MDIESIKKIVDFFEQEIKSEEINLTISLPALIHRKLQKETWEMGNKIEVLEYSDQFNLKMNKVTFTFVIKK